MSELNARMAPEEQMAALIADLEQTVAELQEKAVLLTEAAQHWAFVAGEAQAEVDRLRSQLEVLL